MAFDPRSRSRIPALPLEPTQLAPYVTRTGRAASGPGTGGASPLRSALAVLRELHRQHGADTADTAWAALIDHLREAGDEKTAKRAERARDDLRDGKSRGGRPPTRKTEARVLTAYLPPDVIEALDRTYPTAGADSRNALIERYVCEGLAREGGITSAGKPATRPRRTPAATATATATAS